MKPDQVEIGGFHRPGDGVFGGDQREAELAIGDAGADEPVGVRVDARGEPQQNILLDAFLSGESAQHLQLMKVIDDNFTDLPLQRLI